MSYVFRETESLKGSFGGAGIVLLVFSFGMSVGMGSTVSTGSTALDDIVQAGLAYVLWARSEYGLGGYLVLLGH